MPEQKSQRPVRPRTLPALATGHETAYTTAFGACIIGKSEDVLRGRSAGKLAGKVGLVFTSPPFPLNRKKKYGNHEGEAFKEWLRGYAPLLRDVLTDDGSIVIEMGNAWEPGLPVMSTLAIESLLAFKTAADLYLCQEFIWYNPAKLPTPAQWVTVDRSRLKDAFTRLWWLSPTPKPKADNRNVLGPYSESMKRLLRTQKYNAGRRPSEHVISKTSFLKDNGGAIRPNVLSFPFLEEADEQDALRRISNVLTGSNTGSHDPYHDYCRANGIVPHPARMPSELPEFFIRFCTDPGDLVLDPFSGSNTTGFAAETLGRRWISIETNGEYAKAGRSRFASPLAKEFVGTNTPNAEVPRDR